MVDESTPFVVNMNCEGFYDGETELLYGVNGRGWCRVGVTVEASCFGNFPIMVRKF